MNAREAKKLAAYYYKHPERYTPDEVAEAYALLDRTVAEDQMSLYLAGRQAFEAGAPVEPAPERELVLGADLVRPDVGGRLKDARQRAQAVRQEARVKARTSPANLETATYIELQAEAKARGIKGKHKRDELLVLIQAHDAKAK